MTAAEGNGALLELTDVRTGYGELPVLHGVSIGVEEGETAVVLGLNGAGKSTLMQTVAGTLPPWEGEIVFDREPVGSLDAPARVKRGIALVPEGRRVFPGLTVERNLELGAWTRHEGADEALQEVFDLFPRLADRRTQYAGTLSGGEQQMLAIGRGLMSDPRLLLIDEASLGLAPFLVREVFALVRQIAERGVTVLLVEQNVSALKLADRAFVMEHGAIVYEGSGQELRDSGDIRRQYLG